MKESKNRPPKKLAREILSPENFDRVQALIGPAMSLTLWFTKLQPDDFDKEAIRLEKLTQTFNHRLTLRKGTLRTPAETEQYNKLKKLEKYMVETMSSFKEYVDVLNDADKKGTRLLDIILDEKKQDKVIDNIIKFEQLYTPVVEELISLKKRCNAIPAMVDEAELALRKEVN